MIVAIKSFRLDQGISAIPVVTATTSSCFKTTALVKGSGGIVAACHLQGGEAGPAAAGLLEQCAQQLLPQSLLPMLRMNSHHGQLQLVRHQPAAGHGQQLAGFADSQTESFGIVEFPAPLLFSPESVEGKLIKVQAVLRLIEAKPMELPARAQRRWTVIIHQ